MRGDRANGTVGDDDLGRFWDGQTVRDRS